MMQVLLVDDSTVMRRYVARILEMTGLDIGLHEAGNGREAMSKAIVLRPDLIITDLNMPEMSGEDLLAQVSASAELNGTPVLVLSADRSGKRSDEMLRAGAAAYLTKPVLPEVLRSELVALIEKQKSRYPPDLLLGVLTQILQTMYFCEPESVGPGRLAHPVIASAVRFNGSLRGRIEVTVSEELAHRWATDLLASDNITPLQAASTVSELANVVAGAALSAWQPSGDFHFSLPEELTAAGPGHTFANCFRAGGANPELAVDVVFASATPPNVATGFPEPSFWQPV